MSRWCQLSYAPAKNDEFYTKVEGDSSRTLTGAPTPQGNLAHKFIQHADLTLELLAKPLRWLGGAWPDGALALRHAWIGLLFGQPARSFYATELISLAGGGSGAVQRELARLARSGLATVRPLGNQRHYQANRDSPLFTELCGILQKTVGLAEPLRQALQPLAAQIRAAFVFGSVAKRQDVATSDIDLMVVSDALSYGDVFAAVEATGARLASR